MSHVRTCSFGMLLAASLARCDSDATPAVDTTPDVAVEPLLGLSAISIDESGTPCLLFEDGAIRCWGSHAARINGGVASEEPAIVLESGAAALALGALHGCALLGDGSVRCWGDDGLGQLGSRSGQASALPVPVEGISDAMAIDAAEETTCVVTRRGTVACWGGVLEEYLPSPGPSELPGLQGVIDVALGTLRDQVYALTAEGQVLTWGPPIGAESRVPELQAGPLIPGAVEIDAGQFHLCARTEAGQVSCWGRTNAYGELGRDANVRRSDEPLLIEDWSDVVALGVGQYHSCVVRAEGSVWCWGRDTRHDGARQDSPVPIQIDGVSDARSLSRGGDGSCAILRDTSALCWGDVGLKPVDVPSPIPLRTPR